MKTNNTYYRAAVGAFIVNEDGRLMVILKHNYIDKWNIVKGGIEKGETELEALKRELREELGPIKYKIIIKSKIASAVIIPSSATDEYIGQARNHYWIFVSKYEKFQVPSEEVEKIKWIDIASGEIKKYFGIHDEDGVLQSLLPIEWEQVRKLVQKLF